MPSEPGRQGGRSPLSIFWHISLTFSTKGGGGRTALRFPPPDFIPSYGPVAVTRIWTMGTQFLKTFWQDQQQGVITIPICHLHRLRVLGCCQKWQIILRNLAVISDTFLMIINLFENSYTYLLKCVAFWEDIYAIIGAQTGLVFLKFSKEKKLLEILRESILPYFFYMKRKMILCSWNSILSD